MTVQTVKTICPHCGFESEDEELCRACGKLTDGDIPVRNVSLVHILGSFFSWLQDKGVHGVNLDEIFKEDPMIDPEFSLLAGNIYNHSDDD